MNKSSILVCIATVAGAVLAATAFAGFRPAPAPAKVAVGAAAPSFKTQDSKGNAISLEDYRGKYVVLEWSNFGCPYVQKHYSTGHMQGLQKKYTAKGVVWLTIFSMAPGTHGYYTPDKLTQIGAKKGVASTLIADSDGTVGKLYGAKNTPTMFIIDPNGKIAYMGGIDDKPTPETDDLAGAKNFVAAALDEALAGKPISVKLSPPYGCGIAYGS